MQFSIICGLLITCFYALYFYKQIQLRRQGIKTNRLAKGSKPAKTATVERWLLVATYGTAVIQYLSVFIQKHMLPFTLPLWVRWIGLVIAACGVIIFLLAITTMRDNWRAGVDESQSTEMVTRGVYRFSRNPAFVGFDLLYIGTVLALPNIPMLLAAIVAIVVLHLQIVEEEAYLPSVFGESYLAYKKRTPRYFLFF